MQYLSSSICSYDHGISLFIKISNLYLHDNVGIPQKIAGHFLEILWSSAVFSSEKKDARCRECKYHSFICKQGMCFFTVFIYQPCYLSLIVLSMNCAASTEALQEQIFFLKMLATFVTSAVVAPLKTNS